jgi:simple sugar transport system substrate-binding protein
MKKNLLIASSVLLLSSALWFFAGGSPDGPQPEGASDSKIVLGFSQLGAESEWRSASSASIKEAAKESGIELMFENAQQKQENQIKAIRSFIAHRVDVIAYSPVVETGWDNVLAEAKSVGIPVVLVDRYIQTDVDGLYATFIGSNFVEEGRKAGRWLTGKFDGFSGRVSVVELRGTDGASPTKGRGAGFREALSDDARFEIAVSMSGDFMRSKGREAMERILSEGAGGRIDVLFAHNDDMAMGAIEAMEEHGLAPGSDVVIISVDAQKSAIEALKEGKINCVVECTPYVGGRLMEVAKSLAAGEDIPKVIYNEEAVYTEDDAPEDLPVTRY